MSRAAVEAEIRTVGKQLARGSRSSGVRSRAEDRGMNWLTGRPELRAALFRTVDVAPACVSPAELSEHLAAYVPAGRLRDLLDSRGGAALGGRIATTAVRQMSDRFIVGETVPKAAAAFERLWNQGIACTVDLLGEKTVTPAEGDAYDQRCHEALDALAHSAERWLPNPVIETDAAGAIPRVNLSVKVTALTPLIRAQAPERGAADARVKLLELLRHAQRVNGHLHIDMESLDSRELILELVLELLSLEEFRDGPSAGIVLQAYLRDSEATLDRILAWTRDPTGGAGRRTPLTVRLVKGAYWDQEMIHAAQHGWTPPVWTQKADSDRCFERLSARLIDNFPAVRAAIASHNLRSVAHAVAYAKAAGLAPADVEYQVLRGLGDDLARAEADAGLRCRVYAPVGDIVAGMAYLVRRLLENTANDSFLTSRAGGANLRSLLAPP
jgi:proline dehydrogenase